MRRRKRKEEGKVKRGYKWNDEKRGNFVNWKKRKLENKRRKNRKGSKLEKRKEKKWENIEVINGSIGKEEEGKIVEKR